MKFSGVLVLIVVAVFFGWKFWDRIGGVCENVDFAGKYEGYLEGGGQRLIFEVELLKDEPFVAYSSTPEQVAYDFVSKEEVLSKCNHLSYVLESTGLFVDGNIVGERDGDVIFSGNVEQNGIKGIFYLEKVVEEEKRFYEEEVRIESGDAVLAGTLSFPFASLEEQNRAIQKKSQFSAVILLTGSGPQNRDENIFGFKIFKVLADYLNGQGFAVLRLDDRGVGKSTRGVGDITTLTYANDAIAALNFLHGREDIDPLNIGLLGHSEGAIASLLANSETLHLDVNLQPTGEPSPKIAFIILMAGPAVSGEVLNLWQIEYLARAVGFSEEGVAKDLDSQRGILAAVKGEITWDEAKEKSKPLLLYNLGEAVKAMTRQEIDEYVDSAFEDVVLETKNSWFKFFILNDPAKDIEKLDVPVLVLFGGKDTQVPAIMNETFFRQAALRGGYKDYEIATFPEANHLFQKADTGLLDEYAILEKKFVDGFLEKIGEFLAPFAREKGGMF